MQSLQIQIIVWSSLFSMSETNSTLNGPTTASVACAILDQNKLAPISDLTEVSQSMMGLLTHLSDQASPASPSS